MTGLLNKFTGSRFRIILLRRLPTLKVWRKCSGLLLMNILVLLFWRRRYIWNILTRKKAFVSECVVGFGVSRCSICGVGLITSIVFGMSY